MNQNEIILYYTNTTEQIEVRVEQETVWLTQAQMAELFQTSRNNITLHITNIFKENELCKDQVCKNSLLTANDGKNYKTMFYNLDVIISVGYRVKSQRGVQFRIWANNILKQYLLNGYAVHASIQKLENDVRELQNKSEKFEMYLHTNLPSQQGIFFDGQVFDAYVFVADLVRSANKSILLIDNYIDDSVLSLLSKRKTSVSALIYTNIISKQLIVDLQKHNAQYSPIQVNTFSKSHDRFLIIDNKMIYHIGASLKDLGKKWFAFSKIDIDLSALLERLK